MSSITRLDAPYAQQPETRAAAAAYLTRTGNADLIDMLGLHGTDLGSEFDEKGRRLCPACGGPLRPDRSLCRRLTCERGPKSREVKR